MSVDGRRPLPGGWRAPAGIVAALLSLAALGPAWRSAPERADLPVPRLERDEGEVARAVVGAGAWGQALREAGLPAFELPDGLEHAPVRLLVECSRPWTRAGDPDALGAMAEQCYALGLHDAALDLAVAAHALGEDVARWAYLVGAVAQRLGLHDAALAALEQAAALDADYGVTHARIGTAMLELERLDEADAAFARAAEREPSPALGHQGRARVALRRGDAAAALAHADASLALAARDFQSHRIRALALAALGRQDESRAALARAGALPTYSGWTSFDPRVADIFASSGTSESLEMRLGVALQLGDLDAALTAGEALLAMTPRSAQVLTSLASIHANRANLPRAAELSARAAALSPGSVEVLSLRAEIAIAMSDGPALEDVVPRLLALDGARATSWAIDGRARFVLGEEGEAIRSLRRATSLAPRDPDVTLLLVEVLERAGRRDEAREVLLDALSRMPAEAALQSRLDVLGDR